VCYIELCTQVQVNSYVAPQQHKTYTRYLERRVQRVIITAY